MIGISERMQNGAVAVAAIGAGVMAGIFFIFSNAIMPALADAAPPEGIATMQRFNEEFENPLFLTLFTGTAVASGAAIVRGITSRGDRRATWQLAGGLLYVVGAFGITIVLHVPWNDEMMQLDPASADAAREWNRYLDRWIPWNHVRTISSVAAAICLLVAQRPRRA